MPAPTRLSKVLAHAGIASRRQAEQLILDGFVSVNGHKITTMGTLVDPESDIITVEGKRINTAPAPRLWLYHKPKGLITTHYDPQGRPTVFDDIDLGERVISVGRLDLNTEGLLLLTNHGPWARTLELPGLKRVYKVRFFGHYEERVIKHLRKPFTIEGIHYQAFEVQKIGGKWITITIHEGKNREIRKALELVDLQVSRLIRVEYGPFQLGLLDPSHIQETKMPKILR